MSANNRKRIFLTGFMGCGKSTVGVSAATMLGWNFIDLDVAIEHRAGMRVEDIFEFEGEGAFRAWEDQTLRSVKPQYVCAAGGGALISEANVAWALEHGLVVLLLAGPDVLAQRLEADRQRRPLLEDSSGQRLCGPALMARIQSLLSKRLPSYSQAHVTIPIATASPNEIATRVVAAYRSRKDLR